jgi:creatinine amidohydrolase/Fe(II)-dependent formamide hydrolase-like protein
VNLALHPSLVNMSAAFDEQPRGHALQGEGLTLPLSTVDETSSGVFGKQSTTSAEKGKKVLEACINELVRHVNLLKKTKMNDLMQKQKV